MSDNIPVEVVGDILKGLSVKTLLRCRCVSKSFCALIDSPDFIKLHLDYSIKTNSNLRLFLATSSNFASVEVDSLDNVAEELDYVPGGWRHRSKIVGSCNGLLLLFDGEDQLTLWNPSTRKHLNLPPVPFFDKFPEGYSVDDVLERYNFGFGYDHLNDDYKVVRLASFDFNGDENLFFLEAKVYSLKSNTWRRIQDFPYYVRAFLIPATFASGCLHWVVDRKNREFGFGNKILAFDLATEEYSLLPLPEYDNPNYVFEMDIGLLGGLLLVTCSPPAFTHDKFPFTDTWVMKEYGVKESWSKLISFTLPKGFEFLMPLAYSKCGGQLLWDSMDRFVWYDLETKAVKNVTIRGLPRAFYLTKVCFGSLVQLSGGGSNEKQQHKREKELIEEVKDDVD